MPNIEFLIAAGAPPVSLNEAVNSLKDCSILFVHGWTSNRQDVAYRASRNAFQLFDHIVGVLMRARDDIKQSRKPANSSYIAALSAPAGSMATPVTLADQVAVLAAGHGNGHLPPSLPTITATLEQVLNKVKHQNTNQANFRIVGDRHFMIIAANKPNGTPDCVLEFDVQHFCDLCEAAAAVL